ncbi:hypothetical protein [Streptomyces sp. NBC_01294]|uniref:hypothetical protein n=1 Tax=Streptomyces sp. NBC_01294 TaxID=2903815 RepID=UPI002DD9ED4F|nr:hypothetical protein [Streptomyces sp. NBC_01294]WRZ57369.1 hypothetical protein OG534_13270 [Streptomyces sp. NBC_01294]
MPIWTGSVLAAGKNPASPAVGDHVQPAELGYPLQRRKEFNLSSGRLIVLGRPARPR